MHVRALHQYATPGTGETQVGEARVRFHETYVPSRLLFEMQALFASDLRNPTFAGAGATGDVREHGDGTLVAAIKHWEFLWGQANWDEPFEFDEERSARLNVSPHWHVQDVASKVVDLVSLLEHLVRRYDLVGGLVATLEGTVLARSGNLSACNSVGLAPLLRGDMGEMRDLSACITRPLTPYSMSDGRWVAHFARPTAGLFVVLLRQRPSDAEQPDDWGSLSEATRLAEGRIAERMLHELRGHLQGLGLELV
ncbi:MAG: hypothetical protein MNPFHGCM_03279 [Gemmatimonadaceae bacterium]|nr:hypothetical protein [Gemmatimonadaceae bacterium]